MEMKPTNTDQLGPAPLTEWALWSLLLWVLAGACLFAPAALAAEPALQGEAKAKFQADRKAILAMVGEFDVKFRFRETFPLVEGYEKRDPYLADAKEMVIVVKDEGNLIALQHILVTSSGRVVKHWCQEWKYEDRVVFSYRGHDIWTPKVLNEAEVKGTWTQAVTQTDDSPRYEGIGKWVHDQGYSRWESDETWRPLPRREYKTRSDYEVLLCRHRHTITPDGWVHEQDSAKLDLDEKGNRVLVRESGLNTYFHAKDSDFSAGRSYWTGTAKYWDMVRGEWDNVFAVAKPVVIERGATLNRTLHKLAGEYQEGKAADLEALQQQVRSLLVKHIQREIK